MATWNIAQVQSQLRLTAYRFAQLQDRHEQTSNITKRDIATLISQNNIIAARSKVEKLVLDDRLSTLVEWLESCCNLLLERFTELSQTIDFESKSPLREAVCNLLLVASQTDFKELLILRDMLVQSYGLEFARLSMQDYASRMPPQIMDALGKRPPLVAQVDVYMVSIAKEYDLSWTPPLLPHQKAHLLSQILDQNAFPRTIDLEKLRHICSRGIPSQPPWLRPRVWKLLFGTLSHQKDFWEVDAHSKRQSYYELARSLLTRLNTLPPPATPLGLSDTSLLALAKSLFPLPRELNAELELSPLCPFDDSAPEGLRIETAGAVDKRLKMIKGYVHAAVDQTPKIYVENPVSSLQTPHISVSSPTDPLPDDGVLAPPETVLLPQCLTRSHTTSLLRLLYIHMALNPSTPTLYLSSLLIPLYAVMVQDIEPTELAHVEADCFWLLAELWAEVGELAEGEGSQLWMAKFGQRLTWADPELAEDLNRKGLNPALPHYSYRWLAPLLTRTLPFPSVLTIWDALFTQPPRTNDNSVKLDFLLDICTSMLLHARNKLFSLGRPITNSPGLWRDVNLVAIAPYQSPAELEECFVQGMALLQNYPMEELGGPERVLEMALNLDSRRKGLVRKEVAGPGLGDRLRGLVWLDYAKRTAQPSIPELDNESDGSHSPEWPDSGAEHEGDTAEMVAGPLLGKLGNVVWRGITNQTSMDVPSSPLPPHSPVQLLSPVSTLVEPSGSTAASSAVNIGSRLGNSIWRGLTNQSAMEPLPSPTEPSIPSSSRSEDFVSPNSSSLWDYTDKLKDSDAAASLSKTSTNWTAKAATLWRRSNPSSAVSSPEYPSHHDRPGSLGMSGESWTSMFPKRVSLPTHYDKQYSPPPRPNFRESRYFSPEEHSAPGSPSSSIVGLSSPPDILGKGKSALASLTGSAGASTLRMGPRPLLLSSSSLITRPNPRRLSRSPNPVGHSPQQRDSMSSTTSLASIPFSVARNTTHSDRESESGNGRFVPLRRGVQETLMQHRRREIQSEPSREPFSSIHSKDSGRRTSSEESATRGWGRVELPDSPSTLPASPPPKTPTTLMISSDIRVNGGSERQRGSLVLSESGAATQVPPIERKLGRKKSWNTVSLPPASTLEVTSDSSTSQDNAPPVRSRRHGQRPTNLRLKRSDSDLGRTSSTQVLVQRSPGDPITLFPESWSEAVTNTPRAANFPSPSSPGRSTRVRGNSRSPRRAPRKIGLSGKGSGGEEGDDEGYDEFLSAYESEDGAVEIT